MTEPIAGANSRSGRAVLDVLSAALWSSTAADRMLARLRPADFHPLDDTIAAAVLELRRRGVTWDEPTPVVECLREFQQLWRDRREAGHFGLPEIETPVEDLVDTDRVPLRFAGRALQTCHIYDVARHIPATDVEIAAGAVAAGRRREVSEATMRTVHRILTQPGDSTRAERQDAIGRVLRGYRRDLHAGHLYPTRTQHGTKSAGR